MSQAPQSQSQAQREHGATVAHPGPAAVPPDKFATLRDNLEKLRVEAATQLNEDQLAMLQAAVTEIASLAGTPPGLSQPVTTPPPDPAAQPAPATKHA